MLFLLLHQLLLTAMVDRSHLLILPHTHLRPEEEEEEERLLTTYHHYQSMDVQYPIHLHIVIPLYNQGGLRLRRMAAWAWDEVKVVYWD